MGQIDCQNCGETVRTPRPDRRKWCDTCRALKNLKNLRAKTHECLGCGQRYYAWDSTSARAQNRICTVCLESPVGEERDDEKCAFCASPSRLLPGLALCWPCATQAADNEKAAKVSTSVMRKLKSLAA